MPVLRIEDWRGVRIEVGGCGCEAVRRLRAEDHGRELIPVHLACAYLRAPGQSEPCTERGILIEPDIMD